MIKEITIEAKIFLLNKLFAAKEIAVPRQSNIIALKQYAPIVHESINIPTNTPVKAEAMGEWNIEKAVNNGSIKTGDIPEILIAVLSV